MESQTAILASGDPDKVAKARNELGFEPRPHEETLHDAVEWQLAELGDRRARSGSPGSVLRTVGKALRTVAG